jgi:hypothetical protein
MIATRCRSSVEEAVRPKIGFSPRSCVSDPVSYSAVPIGAPVARPPRSARSSSTSRQDSPQRRYQRTATVITSGGKRNPAKPDLGRDGGTRRRRISPPCPTCDPSTQQSPGSADLIRSSGRFVPRRRDGQLPRVLRAGRGPLSPGTVRRPGRRHFAYPDLRRRKSTLDILLNVLLHSASGRRSSTTRRIISAHKVQKTVAPFGWSRQEPKTSEAAGPI